MMLNKGPQNAVSSESSSLLWNRHSSTSLTSIQRISKPATFLERIKDHFAVEKLQSSYLSEILGGISTFMVSMYILNLEPLILSDAGFDVHSVYIATCIVAGIGSIVMGIIANVPIVVAPGMGMNSFFVVTLIKSLHIRKETALGYTLVHGVILSVVAFFGLRKRVLSAFPTQFRIGVGLGISMFLAFIGFSNMDLMKIPGVQDLAFSYRTAEGVLTLLLIVGLITKFQLRAAYIIGVLVCTIIDLMVRQFILKSGIQVDYNIYHSTTANWGKIAFDFDWRAAIIIPLMVFHHLFDSCSTILTLLQFTYLRDREVSHEEVSIILADSHLTRNAATVDAVVSTIAPLFGLSMTTSFIESSIGIAVGSRTGISSIVTGLLFLSAIGLGPIYNLVPLQATGPVLMMTALVSWPMIQRLDLSDMKESFPALFALFLIPFTQMIGLGTSLSYTTFVLFTIFHVGPPKNPYMWILFIISCLDVALEVAIKFL